MAAKLLDEISRKLERMEADWAAAREAAREKQDRAFHKLNEALAAIAAQLVEESEVVGGDIVSQDDKLAELEAIDASKVDEAIAHSVAHKVLDEMPKPVTDLKTVQVSDLSDASTLLAVNKEFTGLMKDLEELSLQDGLSFDPGGKFRVDLAWNFNVSGDDDVWTVERPIVDDVLMMGEQLAQMETIDGSNVEKEVVDSVAHRMPDEMPKLIFSFNAISDTPILPGAPSIGVVMSEFGQKFIFDSKPVVTDCENFACSASITMWVAYNRVGSVMFDPGGVKVAYVYFAIRLSNGLCADLCCHLRVDSEFSKTHAAQANIKSVMFHPSCVRMPTIDPHLPRCESFSNHLVFQLGKCIECTGAKVADFIRSPGVLSKLVADDRSYRTLVFMKIIMASKCIRLSFAQMLSLVGGLAIEGFRSDSCSMQIFEIFDPGGQLLMHFDESFLKEFSLASVSIGFSFQSLIWNFPPHMEFWEAEFSETKAVVSIQLSSNKLQFLGKEDAAEFELIPFDHGRGLHTADCVDDGENLTFDEGFEPLVFHPQNIFNVQWGIKAKITSTHGGSVAYKNGAKFVDVNGDLVGKFQLRSLKEAQKNLQQSTFIYGELRNER